MNGYKHDECAKCGTEIGFSEQKYSVEGQTWCGMCFDDKETPEEHVSLIGKAYGRWIDGI